MVLSKGAAGYLVLFNAACFAGWSYVLWQVVEHYLQGGEVATLGFNRSILNTLLAVQSTAVLEVIHPLLGLVRSSAFTVLVQVVSRLFIVWAVVPLPFVSVTSSGFMTSLLVAWSVSEIIRYPFYAWSALKAAGIVGEAPYLLAWLRYSGFLVLYPMGVISEIALSLIALPHLHASQYLSFYMPNTINLSFSFPLLMGIALMLYFPGFPFLFSTMLSNRKRSLAAYNQKPKSQ